MKKKKFQFCQRSSRNLLGGMVPIDNNTRYPDSTFPYRVDLKCS